MEKLKVNEIFGRRYFYPSLPVGLPYLEVKNMPIADSVAKRVFCLPLYYELTIEEVDLICRLLLRAQNN
jgi:dTDP-4-amino-4,6-dideoxygalactose transaminase